VSFVGVIAGRGVVVVDHGDTRTTYEPVVAAVARGDHVGAGAVLGRLAPAGSSAGSHCAPRACLHWGWLRGTTYLDPLLLVGAGPVRLLPLGPAAPAYAGWQPSLPAYAGLGIGALTPAGAPAGRRGAGGPW
jgi:murein DD-endopeptidase MepM/ murein hydrolase activator NlpD